MVYNPQLYPLLQVVISTKAFIHVKIITPNKTGILFSLFCQFISQAQPQDLRRGRKSLPLKIQEYPSTLVIVCLNTGKISLQYIICNCNVS